MYKCLGESHLQSHSPWLRKTLNLVGKSGTVSGICVTEMILWVNEKKMRSYALSYWTSQRAGADSQAGDDVGIFSIAGTSLPLTTASQTDVELNQYFQPMHQNFPTHNTCPGWCGSVDWVPACKPKGCRFNSQSGHMPGLQARSAVGQHVRGKHTLMFLSLSLSLPHSLKINK